MNNLTEKIVKSRTYTGFYKKVEKLASEILLRHKNLKMLGIADSSLSDDLSYLKSFIRFYIVNQKTKKAGELEINSRNSTYSICINSKYLVDGASI